MSAKNSVEIGNKKKARDDALQFLETLEITDDATEAQGSENAGSKDADAASKVESGAGAASPELTEKGKEDPKSMLKFIDDLTESAKRSTSPPANEDAKQTAQASGGGWSWGGIWGQATALVEQNAQLKSGLGKLKESIDQVRNTETSKALGSRVKTFVNQENISKLGGELKRGLDTVIDTIAPPIEEHEVFNVRLINNIQDDNLESAVYRTMDGVFDFHGLGEINVKSASKELEDAPEMQTKRGDTFTLPKGFDGGYGAAITAIQYVQHAVKSQNQSKAQAGGSGPETVQRGRPESPLFLRTKKTELYLAVQPFSAMPIEDQGYLSLCVILRDPSRDMTLRTFSQMLPLSCWAQPRDQIVDVDVDGALGSSVNLKSDSIVQRRQEMNEGCLYESVMLAVKTLSNEYLTTRPLLSATASASASAAATSAEAEAKTEAPVSAADI
ncbi:hypothetical protein H4R99_000803 [Coemansia sp. RSA 1722]|nr:hypothetical protein LPJ57_000147 [Coemansia sp. RSA 486]KAJ2237877.1 hypothetical protein IWW45_000619 [Coemansia sp. RSA 485]KAJ2603309.1 hypothetical protein GGF39_000262 [Coemansia sp. RSA 1721]KAJ2605938.1 hypothetical protein H4R99_000803 [Coemansia sp. RSA 1722]KAJ2639900.1 hypothetical protein GGF40_000428 [Coemansia sp. RSA 1286]